MKSGNIERRRLGEQIFDVLARQIMDGRFSPGTHLSENQICAEMGVSRTPVREALFKLEEKGLVTSHPNRGFFVPPLSKTAVRENYPVLATLDALALKTSPSFTKEDIEALKDINEKLKTGKGTRFELYQLDLDFHDILTRRCPNEQLLSLIEHMKHETRQRDGGYKRGLAGPELAYREHLEIIEALQEGDNQKAAGLLEHHWMSGIETVTEWIDSEENKETPHAETKTA